MGALGSDGEEVLSAWHRAEELRKALLDGRRAEWLNGWQDGWIDGWTNGWKGGSKEGWITDGKNKITRDWFQEVGGLPKRTGRR